jgi:hypothetical protein
MLASTLLRNMTNVEQMLADIWKQALLQHSPRVWLHEKKFCKSSGISFSDLSPALI